MALVIVVSGPPASGKTHIAKFLGAELGLPLIAKDAIKESRATKGPKDEQATAQLRAAAVAFWNGVEMAMSPFSALGEVTGQQVERM